MTPEFADRADIARLDGRIDGLVDRVSRVEDWVPESRSFHTRVDNQLTAIAAVERERDRVAAERHAENIDRMNSIKQSTDRRNLIVAIATAIIAILSLLEVGFLGYLTSKANGRPASQLFHTQKHAPVVASDQDASGGEYVPER